MGPTLTLADCPPSRNSSSFFTFALVVAPRANWAVTVNRRPLTSSGMDPVTGACPATDTTLTVGDSVLAAGVYAEISLLWLVCPPASVVTTR